MAKTTDVFIIGGGPAGLALAIAARLRNLEVTIADGSQPPIEKACGEGLMPDGLAALAKLGVNLPGDQSHTFRGIRFVSGRLSVEGSFPGAHGVGIRRTILHSAMVDRAQSLGVSLLWKTPVTGLHPEGVLLGERVVRSRWVVGADGNNSKVRTWAGLDAGSERQRVAFRRHYRISPWSEFMQVYWGASCQIYVTPIAADEICVAVASRDPQMRLDKALTMFPDLASRFHGATCSSAERGAISLTRKLRSVHRGRVALVGDASGSVDCITGEGLGLAFRQAEVLAECLAPAELRKYQREHARLSRRPALMSRLLLALDWRSSLRERVMRAFHSEPRLFTRMVAMHVGSLSPLNCALNGFALGLRMLYS
jgi:flavin-dependent dehydrogenase